MCARLLAIVVAMALLKGVALGADGVVEAGVSIEDASNAMKEAGYKDDGGPEIVPESANSELRMWSVGEGTLVMTFLAKDRKIAKMEYVLMDERPKSTRKKFTLPAVRFSPSTGEMTIKAGPATRTSKSEKGNGEGSTPEGPRQ
ncbi:MAG: hypothetical protein L6R28_23635 [Planctomycetes bacterium]|nr:hypothetical protein [Planctomycetota bacterium]